jgi:hypothetical protein
MVPRFRSTRRATIALNTMQHLSLWHLSSRRTSQHTNTPFRSHRRSITHIRHLLNHTLRHIQLLLNTPHKLLRLHTTRHSHNRRVPTLSTPPLLHQPPHTLSTHLPHNTRRHSLLHTLYLNPLASRPRLCPSKAHLSAPSRPKSLDHNTTNRGGLRHQCLCSSRSPHRNFPRLPTLTHTM